MYMTICVYVCMCVTWDIEYRTSVLYTRPMLGYLIFTQSCKVSAEVHRSNVQDNVWFESKYNILIMHPHFYKLVSYIMKIFYRVI